MVDLEEADGNEELITYGGAKGQAGDPWKNTVTGFRNTTTPNSTSYNSSDTFVWVWNISTVAADGNMSIGFNEIYSGPTDIFISDPISNSTITDVYDFIINDTGFPDEDVGWDNDGNNGSFILEYRKTNTSDPWNATPTQTRISWIGGQTGVINCTALPEGFFDFRVKILDEEGHLMYTPIVYNVAVPTNIPPIADAGLDNNSNVNVSVVIDGSGSTDNSGYIAWFNWTFGDGNYSNGTDSIVTHVFATPGNYTVILNVSDSFGNWDTDTVFINVSDIGAPVTTLNIGTPKYRDSGLDYWNVTANVSTTSFSLSAYDNYVGVNFSWYTIDGSYFVGTSFDLTGYGEGLHNITWGSEDLNGNNETDNYIIVNVDNTPPVIDINISSPRYRAGANDRWNVTDTSIFTISSVDQYSGVAYTEFINMSEGTGPFAITVFTLSGNNDGIIQILYYAYDNVGNGKFRNIWINLDATPPITNISFSQPRFRTFGTDNWNITTSTTLTLVNNSDGSGSGINFTWYTIDGAYYDYSTPFTLTPGVHTLTWGGIDLLGQNDTTNIQDVNVDINPPVSTFNIGSPRYRDNGIDEWNVTSQTVLSVLSSDQYAGVNYSWYYIDGDYYQGALFNLSGYSEGQHTITWGSIDNLGINETPQFINVWLDDSDPLTDLSLGTPRYPLLQIDGSNVTSSTQFTLTGLDKPDADNTGLNYTWYTIDGDYYIGTTFTLSSYSEGPHTITWGSIDYLDNNETGNSVIVWLDDSPPETILTLGMPRYPLGPYPQANVTSETQFTLTGTDYPLGNNSGIDFSWYTIDGALYAGSSFNLSGKSEGMHLISWGSQDNLGINESANFLVVWKDSSPPETSLNIDSTRYPLSLTDGTNVTSLTQFTLTATEKPDAHNSSLNFTWYTIDGEYYEGTAFDLSGYGDGKHTITWGSLDNIGNNETGNTMDVWLDESPPETSIDIGLPRHPQSPFEGTNVTSSTQFTLLGADKPDAHNSGIDITWYTIDGDYYEGTSFDLSGYGEGMHTIIWGSSDNLGNNEIGNTIVVWVDDTQPETQLNIGIPRYPLFPYEGANITSLTPLTLVGSDKPDPHYSGINNTWYTIDGNFYSGTSFDLLGYGEGAHVITWGSIDFLGNNETGNSVILWIDDSQPETSIDIPMLLHLHCFHFRGQINQIPIIQIWALHGIQLIPFIMKVPHLTSQVMVREHI
jgi:hypothetical protein